MFEEYPEVYRSICKMQYVLNRYRTVTMSISGGSDSDIMIALYNEIKNDICTDIHFVYFDTGLEYQATKDHIKYLQDRYKIDIETIKAYQPIPTACKNYGRPFLNKRVSGYIARLQKHNFTWSTDDFETLYKQYPNCKAALRWFTNSFGDDSRFNIQYTKGLREYLINNPPPFKISDMCCTCAKKKTSKIAYEKYDSELSVQGVRKYEGGARNTLNNCWNDKKGVYYPLLWFKESDKNIVENKLNVKHSKCYTDYGLKRTGCAGCPFGQHYNDELQIIQQHEPKLYNACLGVFGQVYEYTNKFQSERW